MAVLIDHFPISVPPGTRSLEAAVDQPGHLILRLARKTTASPSLWDDAVLVAFNAEWSADGGATWRDLGGFETLGGIAYNPKTGEEATETVMECPFPEETDRVRVTATVSGGTLASQVTIERV